MSSICENSMSDDSRNIAEGTQYWEEVEIDIGWGVIRGKQHGSGKQKILAVHGWLDNANSFDLIYPYIGDDFSFLAIDLPGHGKSDHFGHGFIYDPRGYLGAVKKAVLKLGWTKFIYLGHSMGALTGVMYAATFPDDLESFISIDIIQPWSFEPTYYASGYRKYFLDLFKQEDLFGKVPLEYEEDELVEKVIKSSKSLDAASALHLLKRGAYPSECGTKKVLARDVRAKAYFIGFIPFEAWMEMARSIKCPTMIIKAKQGHLYETADKYKTILDAYAENCPLFQFEDMEGKHHLHMTHSHNVGPKIAQFIRKAIEINETTEVRDNNTTI